MLAEVVIAAIVVAITTVIQILAEALSELIRRWGEVELPENVQAELSDVDREEIEATKELIRQCFGENVTECICKASNRERIDLMADFAERLAQEYGLNIEVDVTVAAVSNCGSYNWGQKKAEFNIALLMVDSSNEYFDYCIHETIDTIVHELRHAVQHCAVENKGFWNVEEKRRIAWANNMAPGNYIRSEVDMEGYAEQPIEKDATTFAAMVMEGVQ